LFDDLLAVHGGYYNHLTKKGNPITEPDMRITVDALHRSTLLVWYM
jgi:hypothetical protein